MIPVELSRLPFLEEFSFRGNLLTGSVPRELNHLPDVYVLNLTATRSAADRMGRQLGRPGGPGRRVRVPTLGCDHPDLD